MPIQVSVQLPSVSVDKLEQLRDLSQGIRWTKEQNQRFFYRYAQDWRDIYPDDWVVVSDGKLVYHAQRLEDALLFIDEMHLTTHFLGRLSKEIDLDLSRSPSDWEEALYVEELSGQAYVRNRHAFKQSYSSLLKQYAGSWVVFDRGFVLGVHDTQQKAWDQVIAQNLHQGLVEWIEPV